MSEEFALTPFVPPIDHSTFRAPSEALATAARLASCTHALNAAELEIDRLRLQLSEAADTITRQREHLAAQSSQIRALEAEIAYIRRETVPRRVAQAMSLITAGLRV